MQSANRNVSGQSGFSLIELALVTLIISILLGLGVPSLQGLFSSRLDAAAQRTRAVFSYLHDEAALRGRVYRMNIDSDGGGWTIDSLAPWAIDEDPEFRREWDPAARSTRLEPGVVIAELRVGERPVEGLDAHVYFSPDGIADDITIVVANDKDSRTVTLRAATGIARIAQRGVQP
ncbi:MAG: prepilin-type N-terminal cleavage/methylation domain-containing protein [Hyphomicrobiaceae bacterium]